MKSLQTVAVAANLSLATALQINAVSSTLMQQQQQLVQKQG
jgi:hypothetical protein